MNNFTACSAMKLTSKEGNPYFFRTCDFHEGIFENGAHIIAFSKDSHIPLNENSLTSKFPFMGITYNAQDTWLLDGINSEGLTGGLLMLSEGTSVNHAENGVMGMELITYMLALCKNTDEVTEKSGDIQVLSVPHEGQRIDAAMHFIFADAEGKTVVLEATDSERPGVLKVYRENIGVMTNSPAYGLQLENLKWFLAQSKELVSKSYTKLDFEGTVIERDGTALHFCESGVFPGSYASYDRFVRLAVLKALNNCGNDFSDDEMLSLGKGVMNSVFEPRNRGVFHYFGFDENGTPRQQSDGYTQYTAMYDIKNREMYMLPYNSVLWTHRRLTDV